MDCRMAAVMALAFSLSCGGCVLTQSQTTESPPVPETKPPTKASNAKLASAYAAMREKQAEEADKTPDAQAKLRDDARYAYQEAIRLNPDNLEAVIGLAKIHAQTGNFDLALDVFQKAAPRHGRNSRYWYEKGLCHNRQKDFRAAVDAFDQGLEIDPDNRQILMTLGLTLARVGADDEALTILTRATSSALAHYNLARMQLHLGQRDKARSHLDIALRENPNLTGAREMLVGIDGAATH